MNNIEIIESNYPLNVDNYNTFQYKLPLDFFTVTPVDDVVMSFVEVMKGFDTSIYFRRYRHRGNQGYNPQMMLRVVLFAYMNTIPDMRMLAELCKYDLRYIFLCDGQTPSHMAFQRFVGNRLKVKIDDIFYDLNKRIMELDQIDTSILYIDGTKIEANAKKNSFVWKKAVLKYQENLFKKISVILPDMNRIINENYEIHETYKSKDMIEIVNKLTRTIEENGITCVYGRGHKKTEIQKTYDLIKEYYDKLVKYERHIEICGDRNSYSKTDHDATMMNMKYDYYNQTGVFKPGYNFQIGVSDEYILHKGVYQNPGDTKTFIPFMEDYKKSYGSFPLWPITDAGYGSYDNYFYCMINRMNLGMKYNYYAKKNESKFKKKIYNALNWAVGEEGYKVCPEGHRLNQLTRENMKRKSIYPQLINEYQCNECGNCAVKNECIGNKEYKKIQRNHILEEFQNEVDKNLGSEEGIKMKIQRSIQVEGAFGVIKQDMNYVRLRRRGIENVKLELTLVCIGYNLMKYCNKKRRKVLN